MWRQTTPDASGVSVQSCTHRGRRRRASRGPGKPRQSPASASGRHARSESAQVQHTRRQHHNPACGDFGSVGPQLVDQQVRHANTRLTAPPPTVGLDTGTARPKSACVQQSWRSVPASLGSNKLAQLAGMAVRVTRVLGQAKVPAGSPRDCALAADMPKPRSRTRLEVQGAGAGAGML